MNIVPPAYANHAIELYQRLLIPCDLRENQLNYLVEPSHFSTDFLLKPQYVLLSHPECLFNNPSSRKACSLRRQGSDLVILNKGLPFLYRGSNEPAPSVSYERAYTATHLVYDYLAQRMLSSQLPESSIGDAIINLARMILPGSQSTAAWGLHRDLTNEERGYLFQINLEHMEQKNTSPTDLPSTRACSTSGSEPIVTAFTQLDRFLFDISKQLAKPISHDNKIAAYLRGTGAEGLTLQGCGALDQHGLQFLVILGSPSKDELLRRGGDHYAQLTAAVAAKFRFDFRLANWFTEMRHEMDPIVTECKNRIEELFNAYSVLPKRDTQDEHVRLKADLDRNLSQLAQYINQFGRTEEFANLRDPVVDAAASRARNRAKWNALLPLIIATKKGLDREYGKRSSMHYDRAASYQVMMNEDNFISVFSKLLDNAHKYSPRDGLSRYKEVKIVIKEAGDLNIEITNFGPRLYDDEQRDMGRKFTRGRRAKRSGVLGSGLGLFHADAIARLHGASVLHKQRSERGMPHDISEHTVVFSIADGNWRRRESKQ